MTAPKAGSGNGCLILVAIGIGFGVIRSCSSTDNGPDPYGTGLESTSSAAPYDYATSIPDLSVPDGSEIDRAALHAGRVIGILGETGAQEYSELCYEAVRVRFRLGALDRCYAFDLFAKRLLEEEVGYTPQRFSAGNIQARWAGQTSAQAIENEEGLQRRVAIESAASLTRATIIAPPPSQLKPSSASPSDSSSSSTETSGYEVGPAFDEQAPIDPYGSTEDY